MIPKYSRPEIERRWLVDPTRLPSLTGIPCREIEDKYLDGGRLRLRVVRAAGAKTTYKLGKKYGFGGAEVENIVNIYLEEAEYNALSLLPGVVARKSRYTIAGGSLDVYECPVASPAIFEVEFESESAAAAYLPPDFVGKEVTRDAKYSGFSLAERAL